MPVPTTNYTDAQIRTEVIGTGGSVPSSNYTFMDLVNASDFSRFDSTYLAGATNKDGLVNSDQFRNYPISIACPTPSYSVYYNSWYPSDYKILYGITISNMVSGREYETFLLKEDGFSSDGVVLDSGGGTFGVLKDMRSQVTLRVRFKAFGSCSITSWVDFSITPNYLHTLSVPTAPIITSNTGCVSGSSSAILQANAPSGDIIVWSNGQTGTPISANYAGIWRAWARNTNGYSLQSNNTTVYNC